TVGTKRFDMRAPKGAMTSSMSSFLLLYVRDMGELPTIVHFASSVRMSKIPPVPATHLSKPDRMICLLRDSMELASRVMCSSHSQARGAVDLAARSCAVSCRVCDLARPAMRRCGTSRLCRDYDPGASLEPAAKKNKGRFGLATEPPQCRAYVRGAAFKSRTSTCRPCRHRLACRHRRQRQRRTSSLP